MNRRSGLIIRTKFEKLPKDYHSSFRLRLSNDLYVFDWRWSEVLEGWIYSVSLNNKPIVSGRVARINENLIPNVTGLGVLRLEGDEPTSDNLCTDCQLYYYEVTDDS